MERNCTSDGFFFAVKEVSLLDQGGKGKQSIYQLEQEISLLSQLEHENIVRYYGTNKDDSKLYIFLELVTKGSLLSLYQKYHLQESQASVYTKQILNGLKYLHEQNVVHRDIKCANILVDVHGSVKIADFGLAKATKLNDVKSCRGTPFWMAPEVVNWKNEGYGLATDIWSLGCTVLEMLTRRPPYSHLEGATKLNDVKSFKGTLRWMAPEVFNQKNEGYGLAVNIWSLGCTVLEMLTCRPPYSNMEDGQVISKIYRSEPPDVPDSFSSDARDFILKCLQVNPSDRPTAGELLDHPFVKRPSGPQSPRTSGIQP
uniref:Protein kinase domain-containing protein n=1 Tax=Vitis vinifera TaxID=29760 RepID=F6H8Z9_VITVI